MPLSDTRAKRAKFVDRVIDIQIESKVFSRFFLLLPSYTTRLLPYSSFFNSPLWIEIISFTSPRGAKGTSGRTRLVLLIAAARRKSAARIDFFAARNKLSLNLQRHLRPFERANGRIRGIMTLSRRIHAKGITARRSRYISSSYERLMRF